MVRKMLSKNARTNREKYDKTNILKLVEYIKEEANKNRFNEEELVKKFNESGIYLVIQEDIPGPKIRASSKEEVF